MQTLCLLRRLGCGKNKSNTIKHTKQIASIYYVLKRWKIGIKELFLAPKLSLIPKFV